MRFSTLEAICTALNCQPGDILEFRQDPDARLRSIGRSAHGSTAASVSAACRSGGENEVSLFRLYVLRAMYLVLVIGSAR